MSVLRVQGGRRLEGVVTVGGNKNAALPLIVASLLTTEPVTLAQRAADPRRGRVARNCCRDSDRRWKGMAPARWFFAARNDPDRRRMRNWSDACARRCC